MSSKWGQQKIWSAEFARIFESLSTLSRLWERIQLFSYVVSIWRYLKLCVLSKETLFLIKFTMFSNSMTLRYECVFVSVIMVVCVPETGWFVALQVQGYSQVLRWGLPSSYPLPGSVEPQPLPPVCPGSSTQTAEWGMVLLWTGATASVVPLEGHWSLGKAQHHPTESKDTSVITQTKETKYL